MSVWQDTMAALIVELEKHDPDCQAVHFAKGVLYASSPRGRKPREFENLDELIQRYHAGESVRALALEVGASESALKKAFALAGVKFIPKAQRWVASIDREEFARRYEAGESILDLSSSYGVDILTIRTGLASCGVKIRKKGVGGGMGNKRLRAVERHVPKIMALRAEGKSGEEIGRELGISRERVRQLVVRAGLKEKFEERPFRPHELEAMRAYHEDGEGLSMLAQKLGLTHVGTAAKWLTRAGYPVRPSTRKLNEKGAREEKARQIAEHYKAGKAPAEIARIFNMAKTEQIYRYLGIAGVKPDRQQARSTLSIGDGG